MGMNDPVVYDMSDDVSVILKVLDQIQKIILHLTS